MIKQEHVQPHLVAAKEYAQLHVMHATTVKGFPGILRESFVPRVQCHPGLVPSGLGNRDTVPKEVIPFANENNVNYNAPFIMVIHQDGGDRSKCGNRCIAQSLSWHCQWVSSCPHTTDIFHYDP